MNSSFFLRDVKAIGEKNKDGSMVVRSRPFKLRAGWQFLQRKLVCVGD